jgi:hypothetical protein
MSFRDCTIENGFVTTETQRHRVLFQHGGHGEHGEKLEIGKGLHSSSVRSVIPGVNMPPILCASVVKTRSE